MRSISFHLCVFIRVQILLCADKVWIYIRFPFGLKVARRFQRKFITAHFGGSIFLVHINLRHLTSLSFGVWTSLFHQTQLIKTASAHSVTATDTTHSNAPSSLTRTTRKQKAEHSTQTRREARSLGPGGGGRTYPHFQGRCCGWTFPEHHRGVRPPT